MVPRHGISGVTTGTDINDEHRIGSAMVLAAGLGTRMRPITETLPKPLVEVAGRTLLDRALDALRAAGISRAVVNVHHLADRMEAHLKTVQDMEIVISDERQELLDSGGGIAKALPALGDAPFVILNADTFWLDDEPASPALGELIAGFDPATTDIAMLVADLGRTTGHGPASDFRIDGEGRLERFRGTGRGAVVYAGALLVHPRIFAGAPDGPFSLNRLFDAAIASGRLRAHRLAGHWLTVGTPEAIGEAEAALEKLAPADRRAG